MQYFKIYTCSLGCWGCVLIFYAPYKLIGTFSYCYWIRIDFTTPPHHTTPLQTAAKTLPGLKTRTNSLKRRNFGAKKHTRKGPPPKNWLLTLFQLLVFLRSVQMVTNQKVPSKRASDKSRVSRVGSIVIAVSRAFQKGGGRLLSEQGLAPYTRL